MAAAPFNWNSFGAEDNNFPLPYALGIMQHFQCTRHQFRCKMQHLGQGPVGPSSGYLKWSVWVVVVVVVVGFEPVHDSEHVTYRLLAPAQSPVGGRSQ